MIISYRQSSYSLTFHGGASEMNLNVFLVDNSCQIRSMIEDYFSDNPNLTFFHARNSHETYSQIQKVKPDCIICDPLTWEHAQDEIDCLYCEIRQIKASCPKTKVIVFENSLLRRCPPLCSFCDADYILDKNKDFKNIPEILESMIEQG